MMMQTKLDARTIVNAVWFRLGVRPEAYDELTRLGEEMHRATEHGGSGTKKFANLDSGISNVAAQPQVGTTISIDVGGTNTKVVVRIVSEDGTITYKPLFEMDNNLLCTPSEGGNLYEQFCGRVAAEVARQATERQIDLSEVKGLGIVWSNAAIISKSDIDGVVGLKAVVTGKDDPNGPGYNKNEPWNSSLHDGDDLTGPFLQALKNVAINPKAMVIGNDTVFVACAYPSADGGVVASSGANNTALRDESLRSEESGGSLTLPAAFYDKWMLKALQGDSATPVNAMSFEAGIAGKWQPKLFLGALEEMLELQSLSQSDREALQTTISQYHRKVAVEGMDGQFDNSVVSHWAKQKIEATTSVLDTMRIAIAQQLEERAAKIAARMVYFSVSNQLGNSDKNFVVALDSTLAEHFPRALSIMRDEVAKLGNGRIRIEHLKAIKVDDGKQVLSVSVATQGVFGAIDKAILESVKAASLL